MVEVSPPLGLSSRGTQPLFYVEGLLRLVCESRPVENLEGRDGVRESTEPFSVCATLTFLAEERTYGHGATGEVSGREEQQKTSGTEAVPHSWSGRPTPAHENTKTDPPPKP